MRPKQSRPRLLQAMLDAFSLPDLRRRILFTLGVLVVFRFIAHIPLPGVNPDALAELFQRNALLGMLDMFSGGAMRYFSMAAMGVYPYITSSIVMQLMVPVIPRLRALAAEGEGGRNQINKFTHWLTIPMAGMAAYGQMVLLQREGVLASTGLLATLAMVITMIAGTMFLVWLGELITEYGIGNGISIIIFGGIVAGLWEMIGQGRLAATTNLSGLAFYLVLSLLTAAIIVIFTEAPRRIPVQYSRSVFRGGRMCRHSGQTFIPLRVNASSMIALIFAMSVVVFPGVVAGYFGNPVEPNFANTIVDLFNPNAPLPLGLFYWGIYFMMVLAFAFFYTMVIYQQQNLPETLQRQGGFVPGIRPGPNTATYLNNVINRITWAGALFLAGVAIMPFLGREITNVQQLQLSSIGMLIVVGVVLDTMKQLEAQLVMRRYEGFIK